MGKSTGTTRASSSRAPKGIQNQEVRMGGGRNIGYSAISDNVLDRVDATLSDISDLLTDRDVRQEFSFGDGYMARITINTLPNGNNQATLGVYNDEDGFLGSQRIVLNPVRSSEVRQAAEDIRDRIVQEIIEHRNNQR